MPANNPFSPIDPADELRVAREWSVEQGQKDRDDLSLLRGRLQPPRSPIRGSGTDESVGDPLTLFESETKLAHGSPVRVRTRTDDKSAEPARWAARWAAALRWLDRTAGWSEASRTDRTLVLLIAAIVCALPAAFLLAPGPPPTGWVMIASTPPGAPVSIDGTFRGLSPFGTSLSPGKHQVDVGREPNIRRQTFYVTAKGDTAVHIELPTSPDPATINPTGGIEVATEPPNAQVWVDGKPRGTAPVRVHGLSPGPHDVIVKGPRGSVTRRVTVENGKVASLVMSMRGGFASGSLTIVSPVPAEIRERGTLLGSTITPSLLLPAGERHLEISNPAFGYRVERTVRIGPSQRQSITLEVPHGRLYVNALPWAEVWVDGKRLGDTPIGNISLPIGNHDLLLRHPELGERRRTVAIRADGPVRVGVDLRQ